MYRWGGCGGNTTRAGLLTSTLPQAGNGAGVLVWTRLHQRSYNGITSRSSTVQKQRFAAEWRNINDNKYIMNHEKRKLREVYEQPDLD